jgi:hypothetical protein
MDSVYMNNFRGFTRTVVSIRSVNFLVGENSTGKSSFLALAQLLSQPEFWFTLDFNTGNYEFGGYRDIVSALSPDQSEFQIGVCKENAKKPEENTYYLLHFRQAKDGVPELAQFSQLSKSHCATMRLSEKQLSAAISTDVPDCVDRSSPDACFAFLQEAGASTSLEYKQLSGDERNFMRRSPIPSFPGILSQLFEDKTLRAKIEDVPFPILDASFASMAPIRTTPKRTYDGYTKRFSPEGEHTPYVIRERLPQSSDAKNKFKTALEAFGRDSGLFQSVGITQFGEGSASPFELTVTLGKKALRVNSVGYGVSQVLPVVVELLTHGKKAWLAIQQPEVHLHPKAQAALGDVLFHAAIDESQTLLVETHSDYLIDRFRLSMRDHKHPKHFAQVIFFERTIEGNRIYPMVVDTTGEYPEDQPPAFRKFFLTEQKRILGV